MDLPDLEATLLAVRPATHAMKSSFSYSSGYQGDHHVSFSVISFDYCYQPPPERDARSLNATTSEGWSIGSHSNIFKFLPRDIGLARSQPIADRHGVETRNRDMVLVQVFQPRRDNFEHSDGAPVGIYSTAQENEEEKRRLRPIGTVMHDIPLTAGDGKEAPEQMQESLAIDEAKTAFDDHSVPHGYNPQARAQPANFAPAANYVQQFESPCFLPSQALERVKAFLRGGIVIRSCLQQQQQQQQHQQQHQQRQAASFFQLSGSFKTLIFDPGWAHSR
ncbi:MAG: hypothetical protein FE78DRAFT_34204 [Acidomyces sp. 'richmondensis']|nr:MAG: hypothetical protein FE78DRAFT_34204 [Acidomyces sp. 'richmondensis']